MSDKPESHTSTSKLIGQIVPPILIFMGVSENLLTIFVILKDRQLRTIPNAFILNLAIFDLLFSLVVGPLMLVSYITDGWYTISQKSPILCFIFPYIFYGTLAGTLLTMSLLSINRYVLVVHHQLYQLLFTRTKIFFIILSVWIFNIGYLSLPATRTFGEFGYERTFDACVLLSSPKTKIARQTLINSIFLGCLVVIFYCNIRIYVKVKSSKKSLFIKNKIVDERSTSEKIKQPRRGTLRLIKMISIILLSFCVCNIPIILAISTSNGNLNPILHVCLFMLLWLSSLLNPITYSAMNSKILKSLFSLIKIVTKSN